ncbi:YheC/YheD family protein, partial [Paenibacillus sepulcri]|nr:YheC/YheD family protein [Paenibacillus sepulcri]
RFHMHKNGDNEWVPVGIGAKKAGRGSVTTHIKNGGSLLTPKQALSKTFGDQDEEILEKAKKVSIKLSEAIERNFPHTLGELGLDLGIDKDGEVWMFEANAKPGRSIFSHPALRSEGRASLSHILDHCMYLSNFRRGND